MKKLNRLNIILLLNIFLVACAGSGSDSEVASGDGLITEGCDRIFTPDDVYIVDLSQNSTSGVACTMTSDREEIASCVEGRMTTIYYPKKNLRKKVFI